MNTPFQDSNVMLTISVHHSSPQSLATETRAQYYLHLAHSPQLVPPESRPPTTSWGNRSRPRCANPRVIQRKQEPFPTAQEMKMYVIEKVAGGSALHTQEISWGTQSSPRRKELRFSMHWLRWEDWFCHLSPFGLNFPCSFAPANAGSWVKITL